MEEEWTIFRHPSSLSIWPNSGLPSLPTARCVRRTSMCVRFVLRSTTSGGTLCHTQLRASSRFSSALPTRIPNRLYEGGFCRVERELLSTARALILLALGRTTRSTTSDELGMFEFRDVPKAQLLMIVKLESGRFVGLISVNETESWG